MMLLAATLGAVWRVADGSQVKPKGWHLLPIPFIVAAFILGGWQLGVALTIAYISLLDGFHGWHDFGYMSMRYTGYAALACAVADVSLWYIVLAFFAGMMYPALHKLSEKIGQLPHYGIVNNYTTYCEAVCGAVMFGGAFL